MVELQCRGCKGPFSPEESSNKGVARACEFLLKTFDLSRNHRDPGADEDGHGQLHHPAGQTPHRLQVSSGTLSVSDPYLLNPDPATNLNPDPDPEGP